jgi:hypothetical protein
MTSTRNRIRFAFITAIFVFLGACTDTDKSAPAPSRSPAPEAPTPNTATSDTSSAPAHVALPAAEDLLARAVDAVGGVKRLAAIESIHYTGKMTIAGHNIIGELALWWKGGEFYMETTMIGIGKIRAGKRGDVVWSQDPILGLRTLAGKEAEQAEWQSELFLAAEWQDHFAEAETVEARELDGRPVYDVKLTSAAGDEVLMTFDRETGLQVAQSFSQVSPTGAIPLRIKMEDYRDVDGLKVAFRQVMDASIATMEQQISSVEFNVEVDESRFAMPSAASGSPAPKTEPESKSRTGRAAMPFGPDGKPGRPVPTRTKRQR